MGDGFKIKGSQSCQHSPAFNMEQIMGMVGFVAIYDGVGNCGICIRIVGHKLANHRANECILGHARADAQNEIRPVSQIT